MRERIESAYRRDRQIIESGKYVGTRLTTTISVLAMHLSATDTGGGSYPVIQSPPTRWHVLFSVLVSADSINRRDGDGIGGYSRLLCSPPFLPFSFPSARISRTSVYPSLPSRFSLSLLSHVRPSRFILTARGVSARGHVGPRRTRFNCTPN